MKTNNEKKDSRTSDKSTSILLMAVLFCRVKKHKDCSEKRLHVPELFHLFYTFSNAQTKVATNTQELISFIPKALLFTLRILNRAARKFFFLLTVETNYQTRLP